MFRTIQEIHKGLFILTLAVLPVLSFNILKAEAQQLVCPMRAIEQITDEEDGNADDKDINADGTLVTFDSNQNINGGNPGLDSKIYLFDSTTKIITQLTDEAGENSDRPSINADGSHIAFDSTGDFAGTNPGEARQIFLLNRTTGIFTQVTFVMVGDIALNASISADGTRIAFESDGDINGGNPDGNREIYLFNVTTGIITQITDTAEANQRPSLSADGTRIAFESEADINGGNPDGSREIYLFDTTTSSFTQITNGPAGTNSGEPSISADGNHIAFDSDANINGGNPDGNDEIYVFDITTFTFTQVTDEVAGDSTDPSINEDGTRVAFDSDANINGGNPDGNDEIYLFDSITAVIIQITSEPAGDDSFEPEIDYVGTIMAFESEANINGGNPDGNDEIYLARCFDPMNARNVPTLSEWGLIVMAGLIGIIGLFAIRKRKALA